MNHDRKMDNYRPCGSRRSTARRAMRLVAVVAIAATIMMTGCSRKGIHMSKHRKSRKCNCPTFAAAGLSTATITANKDNTIVYHGIARGRI